jgi:hypothetical protein
MDPRLWRCLYLTCFVKTNTWNYDNVNKRRLVQNVQNKWIVDTAFEEWVSGTSFIETCNFLRSQANRYDQQKNESSVWPIHNTYQSPVTSTTKKDKIKSNLVLINELQGQDKAGSDDELNTPTLSKTIMMCKLVQVPPEIRMTLAA